MILAHAKINLALVVGNGAPTACTSWPASCSGSTSPTSWSSSPRTSSQVEGFEDTLVRDALERLAAAAGTAPRWRVRIDKRIPVAAGLGGGSADAGAVLQAANAALPHPLPPERLVALAAQVGSDVPFFCAQGPQLVEGTGARLTPLELRRDYALVVALPNGAAKPSTGEVFRRYDELDGPAGFAERRAALTAALAAGDLAALPPNDLGRAAPPALLPELREAGAFRADLSGAGPAVYGLFADLAAAELAAAALGHLAQVWVARPV